MDKLKKSENTGYVLPLVMVVLLILLVIGSGLVYLGMQGRIRAVRNVSDIIARTAADAGLAKAVFEMNEKLKAKPFSNATLPIETNQLLSNCDAFYSFTVSVDAKGIYSVKSIGNCNKAENQVYCTLRLRGPFDWAIAVDDTITLHNSAAIDWYNNDSDDEPLKVATNSIENAAVDLKNSIKIYGDVAVGVGGDPDEVINEGTSITITGEKYAMPEEMEFIPVTVPVWLQTLPSGGTINGDNTITTSGKYDKINLINSNEITIKGNVLLYITGDVILGNSCKITIENDGNSSLELYIGGNLEAKNSSEFNNKTEIPKNFKLYGLDSCTNLRLKNSTDYYGVIYAPKADIIFDNSINFYGAIVGKTLDMVNSAMIYYDASLRDVTVNDQAVRFTVNRWTEE